jgi:hypothetical protein
VSPQPDPVVLGVLFESVPGLEPCDLPFETGFERLAQLSAVLGDLNPVDAGLKRVALQPMKKKSSAVDECWRLLR